MGYQGTVNTTRVRAGEIFREAIKLNATALIIAHNHPSRGFLEPSREDIEVTKRLAEAGRILDVELLDHLILNEQSWVSLKEHNADIW